MAVVLVRFPGHLADPQWPAHAKAHLVSQIAAVASVCVASLLVLLGPYRRGRRWTWWCLLVCGLGLFGGYWLGLMIAEPELPWRGTHTFFASLSASYAGGLVLGWRHFSAESGAGG